MSPALIKAIGFTAQILFSSRILIQWIASERAKKVLSPVIFWQLSMAASLLLCVYGWLRHDFAIIAGQLIAYYIYIWNLGIKGSWAKLPLIARTIFITVPAAAVFWFLFNWNDTIAYLFKQQDIPTWLIIFGIIGQLTFTLRFVYQWWYSRKVGESLLPVTFWLISITGSVLIITYGIIRRDIVIIIGQSAGLIAYVRNVMIGMRYMKEESELADIE